MSYTSYRNMEEAIRNRVEFTGNSARGYWDGEEYIVVSYNTAIAKANRVTVVGATRNEVEGGLWLNPNKYSVTTSRLQNIVRRAWGVK